ncbi:MAG: hypothetical protein JNM93_02785 [Bacteriovoracaceae bacterium]|nr:hypothetical protein [Bacteriovoracaceae bacterium]
MEEVIKKFEHNHHLQHLVQVFPFIFIVFLVQVYLIKQFYQELGTSGEMIVILGLGLVSMLSMFIIYDSFYKITLYQSHLHLKFLFFVDQKIPYGQITGIELQEEEASFTNITLHLNKRKKRMCYFVDDPKEFKALIAKKLLEAERVSLKKAA